METPNVVIVFICHDNITTHECLQKVESSRILFVGDNPVADDLRTNSRVTIARDLPHNIEIEKKLLTFTAWYAVIKNELFKEYDYLCLFEYDVVLDPVFEKIIQSLCFKKQNDVVAFIMTCGYFLTDINEKVLDEFMIYKGIHDPNKYKMNCWYASTNHCIRRTIISDFVDWYYPDCLTQIKEKDYAKLSWYHERLFYVYMKHKELSVVRINGVNHLFKDSHRSFQ
jgi:hypothetical protein